VSEFVREARQGGNPFILVIASVAALGGFLFGYDTGVIGGAMLYLKKDLHASSFDQQAIVGSLLIGAVLGAIAAGYLADAISRKWTKFCGGCVYVLGALGSAFSPDVWSLIGSRFVLGLAVGAASFVSPLYISELAPKKLRGGMVSLNQLMITSGIAIAYLVNYGLRNVGDNWRWMLGLGAVPGVLLALGMIFVPHTPRWLVEAERDEEAEQVLQRARGEDEDVQEEIQEIEEVSEEEGTLSDLLAKSVRPLLVVGLGLAIFQQLVGVNTVIYYAPTILTHAGVGNSGALGDTVFIGVTNVVFTIVAILLLDKLGRRVFLLVGTSFAVVGLAGLGVYFASKTLQASYGWIALASLLVFIAGFAVGLGPVFWLMIAEIYPLKIRGPAMSVATVANWGANFLVSFTFLTLTGAISREGVFWLYGGIGIVAILFFAKLVPETKDKSLEQIEQELGAEDVTSPRDRRQTTA
jgi:sugar porter (SP) family MFS transporter